MSSGNGKRRRRKNPVKCLRKNKRKKEMRVESIEEDGDMVNCGI